MLNSIFFIYVTSIAYIHYRSEVTDLGFTLFQTLYSPWSLCLFLPIQNDIVSFINVSVCSVNLTNPVFTSFCPQNPSIPGNKSQKYG